MCNHFALPSMISSVSQAEVNCLLVVKIGEHCFIVHSSEVVLDITWSQNCEVFERGVLAGQWMKRMLKSLLAFPPVS
jgi:hypothetical protein